MVVTINDLVKILKQNFHKVSFEEQSDYHLIVLNDGLQEYALCFSRNTSNYVYAKLINLGEIGSFDCNDIVYYNPKGLYVFAKSLEEFVNKLKSKVRFIK